LAAGTEPSRGLWFSPLIARRQSTERKDERAREAALRQIERWKG
jgi:hypothetical protein